MNVESLMTKAVITATGDESLNAAARKMRENQITHLPIVNGQGGPIGVVTDRDIKRASASDATSLEIHELLYLLEKVKLSEVMTAKPLTVNPGTPIAEAARTMIEKHIGCLPVVDSGSLVGIITRTDVLKYCAGLAG